jgi:hypothetical protein
VATAACTDISGSADHIAALQFDALPSPAVVSGDTLRDSLGFAVPLGALAYNTHGSVIDGAAIQYVTLDTGVTIASGGLLVAHARSGSVRILANAGSLQSSPLTLLVTRRPDSVAVVGASRDTVDYVLPDNASANRSADLGVKVFTSDTAGGVTVTEGWRVSYSATFRGQPVAPGDTSVVFLADGNRRTTVDTTSSAGTAGRQVRVRPIGITASAVDSVIVTARVRYRGADVRGSPLHFVILLRPKS